MTRPMGKRLSRAEKDSIAKLLAEAEKLKEGKK
jgi:hypothetical protein